MNGATPLPKLPLSGGLTATFRPLVALTEATVRINAGGTTGVHGPVPLVQASGVMFNAQHWRTPVFVLGVSSTTRRSQVPLTALPLLPMKAARARSGRKVPVNGAGLPLIGLGASSSNTASRRQLVP